MPEGHTIHRAARDHECDLGGQLVKVSSPQGRFDTDAFVDARGRARLRRVDAYGKHLFYVFDRSRIVHVHLGLFGKFYRRRSKTPIGAVLLDQSRICGVGNVYRAEVLHLLGIHPETPSSAIPPATVRAMWRLVAGLLRRGVEEKRIVTTRLSLAKARQRVPRGERTHVYGRKTCRTCKGDVLTYLLRARVVHDCRACQPLVATIPGAGRATIAPSPGSLPRAPSITRSAGFVCAPACPASRMRAVAQRSERR
jgi:formamidopyrimidine-DNA glycosylase